MRPPRTNRRGFIGAAATAGAVPFIPWSAPAFANDSANDRPLIGCIGLGGMGTGDARGHAAFMARTPRPGFEIPRV